VQYQERFIRSASVGYRCNDKTILRNTNEYQDQDYTKEDEKTLWEMTRGPHSAALGLVFRLAPS
jgi:hypothetical protein